MNECIININQPLKNRICNMFYFFKKSIGNSVWKPSIECYTLHKSEWYEREEESNGVSFRWSYPSSSIRNIDSIELSVEFTSPVVRNITFSSERFKYTFEIHPDIYYICNINTTNVKKIDIKTESFIPENDARELGICVWKLNKNPLY